MLFRSIADNKLALNAGWDEQLLGAELEALRNEEFNSALTGFNEAEIEKLLGQFNADAGQMPNLSDEDRQPFQQKTFVLHDEQAEEVELAIAKAKEEGHGQSPLNENSNGNAIAFVCLFFNRKKNK